MNKKKLTLLLINPYIEDFAAYDHFSKPLGLIWLASYLKKYFNIYFINTLTRINPKLPKLKFKDNGCGNFYKKIIEKPKILEDIPRDFKRYGIPEEIFLEELLRIPCIPDFILITSIMTYWYTGVIYTIKLIRKIFKNSKIILGGIYPTLIPDHAKNNIPADYIVHFQDLKLVLNDLSKIFNIEIDNNFLVPDYDLLNEYYYLPIISSVGCIFNCSYCASYYLSKFKQFDPTTISEMIINLNRKFGTTKFAFYDDALLVNSKNHIDIILYNIINKNLNFQFYTPNGLHIRYLNYETALLMKKVGFVDIRLSLESSKSDFQKNSGGKTTNLEFENAIDILYKVGFKRNNIKVYVLLNVPGISYNDIENTMKYIYNIGGTPMLAFYSPIPNTNDFEKAKKITDLNEPLFHNNTVYLYRSGFDIKYFQYLKSLELNYRKQEYSLK